MWPQVSDPHPLPAWSSVNIQTGFHIMTGSFTQGGSTEHRRRWRREEKESQGWRREQRSTH